MVESMPRVIGSWLKIGIFRRLGCSVGRGIVAGILFDCLTQSIFLQGRQWEVIKKEQLHFLANLTVNYHYR